MHLGKADCVQVFLFFCRAKVDLRIGGNGIYGASKLPSMSAPDGCLKFSVLCGT